VQDEEQEKLATSSHKFVQDARQANTGGKPAGFPKKRQRQIASYTHRRDSDSHALAVAKLDCTPSL